MISWQSNSESHEIVQHAVLFEGGGETRMEVVSGVQMMVNITELEPGTEYTFTITSENSDGQKSPPSESLIVLTLLPGRSFCLNVDAYTTHYEFTYDHQFVPCSSN